MFAANASQRDCCDREYISWQFKRAYQDSIIEAFLDDKRELYKLNQFDRSREDLGLD